MEQLRHTFNLCIKKSRTNSESKATIYFRLTIDQDRKEKQSICTLILLNGISDWVLVSARINTLLL